MLARSLALLFLLTAAVAVAAPSVMAPDVAAAGSQVTVAVVGSQNPRDFLTIVPKGSRPGAYNAYQYVGTPAPLRVVVPPEAGEYEVRLLGAQSPYPTLASRPLRVESVSASVQAPSRRASSRRSRPATTSCGIRPASRMPRWPALPCVSRRRRTSRD